MDFKDLQQKNKAELADLLAEQEHEVRDLRFKAYSRQLKQVHKVALLKKTIARIHLLLARA